MSEVIEKHYQKDYVRRPKGPELYEVIRPHFLDFHRLTVYGNCEYPEHLHKYYEVIWVERGPYFCKLNNVELEIGEGRVLVIKPGDSHQDHLVKEQSHFVLHFTLNEDLFASPVKPASQAGMSELEKASDILREMKYESSASGNTDRFTSSLQDALLETLFWRIVRLLPESSLSETFNLYSRRQDFISDLYRIFSESQNSSVSVETVAGKMGISKRSLSMKCRKYLNESPAKLFLNYRIEQAENLLARGNRTIKEISYELGFDSPFNFSRAFKRVAGISPSDFSRFDAERG